MSVSQHTMSKDRTINLEKNFYKVVTLEALQICLKIANFLLSMLSYTTHNLANTTSCFIYQ